MFTRIIPTRIQQAVDDQMRKEKAGFRKERSCKKQIFTPRNIIERYNLASEYWMITKFGRRLLLTQIIQLLHDTNILAGDSPKTSLPYDWLFWYAFVS